MVELSGKRREDMNAFDRGKLRTLIETFDEGLNVGDDVIIDVFEIFATYIPELKTAEGQRKLGLEKRFMAFLKEPLAFAERVDHLGETGGGAVLPFARVNKN
jgi:hypothetical protein